MKMVLWGDTGEGDGGGSPDSGCCGLDKTNRNDTKNYMEVRVLLVMGEQSRLNLSSFVRVSALGFELNWARSKK